eukprot:scaffold95927_cov28-Phaeocystis_antarctica.AAC.1
MPIPAVNGSALLPLPMRQSPKGSVTPSHVVETDTGKRGRRKGALLEAKGYDAQEDEEDYNPNPDPGPNPNPNPNPNPSLNPKPNQDEEEEGEEEEDYYEDAAAAEEEAEAEGEGEGEERHIVHLLHAKGRPMEPGSELT